MANRIKELRRAQGLTLQQLADKAGCSLQQIQRLELGSRRLTDQWMRRVAWALGVPISALLPDFPVDNRQFIESPEEKAVIRWWRAMDPPERDMIVAIARAKGVEILADNTKKRRA